MLDVKYKNDMYRRLKLQLGRDSHELVPAADHPVAGVNLRALVCGALDPSHKNSESLLHSTSQKRISRCKMLMVKVQIRRLGILQSHTDVWDKAPDYTSFLYSGMVWW